LQFTPAPISTVNGAQNTCRQGEVHPIHNYKISNASYDLGYIARQNRKDIFPPMSQLLHCLLLYPYWFAIFVSSQLMVYDKLHRIVKCCFVITYILFYYNPLHGSSLMISIYIYFPGYGASHPYKTFTLLLNYFAFSCDSTHN
jgi:hypothetical protein